MTDLMNRHESVSQVLWRQGRPMAMGPFDT